MSKLNALKIRTLQAGKYPDGSGLYLNVKPCGSKSWTLRYMIAGRRREMGLGSFELVSLAEARFRVNECRRDLMNGVDPLSRRAETLLKARVANSQNVLFSTCVEEYIEAHKAAWTNARWEDQWRNSLAKYAYPVIGSLPVSHVDKALVIRVLRPMWHKVPETARRVRLRIERVMGYAKAVGYRSGDNPAAWRDNLDHVLPSARTSTRNLPSLNRDELPELFNNLAGLNGMPYRALEFLILTAVRTSECLGAKWDEFDIVNSTWTIPEERMKSRKKHRVPLCGRAIQLLRDLQRVSRDEFVFPGRIAGRPLSNMAMVMVMRRFGRTEVPHGFRSTFRDWVKEKTNYSREAGECALAHAVADKTEAAYSRGDMFEKRIPMMAEWAEFCFSKRTALRVSTG